MEEIRVDMRETTEEERHESSRQAKLVFRLNTTLPRSPEYMALLAELFAGRLGEGSYIGAPLSGICFDRIHIGRHAFISGNLLAMASGGITIGDGVQIASNVQLLTNNHDPYRRYAIVGAAAVVTKDVPDYGVAVGSPAKVVRLLDADRFS